ncbi:MAG: hypothetical protein IJ007_03225 [Oscillospiraceae bacterium]|nr:hypothetical protein [Oscillospiraceae bacterium]
MKNRQLLKITAFTAALCMSAAMLSGCTSSGDGSANNTDSGSASVTTVPADENAAETTISIPEMHGTRRVEEGDVYAINKFTVDPLPANYVLAQQSQLNQGKLYLNGVSKITVMACNYKEDFQSLDIAMETACASLKMNNMLMQCDTEFEEPVKTTVAGFDALSTDFLITANTFVKEDPNAEGDGVKTPVGWYKSRIVYFFSDKDVYYCIFETNRDDWDKTIVGFEEFIANIKIDETAENIPMETVVIMENGETSIITTSSEDTSESAETAVSE